MLWQGTSVQRSVSLARIYVNELIVPDLAHQLMVLYAIENGQTDQLKRLGLHIMKEKDCRKLTALLALDHFFDDLERIEIKTKLHIKDTLHVLHVYAALIQNIMAMTAPAQDQELQLLFAFKLASAEQITLLDNTWLYRTHERYTVAHKPTPDEAILSPQEFATLLRHALAERLRDRLLIWSERLLASTVFDPCMVHASTGNCNIPDCSHQHTISVDVYNERASVMLDQILLLQVVSNLPPDGLAVEVKMYA